ncbi:unnamed protein product [Musa banksii]
MAARRRIEFGSVASLLLMGVFFFCIWPPSPAFAYGGNSTAENAKDSEKIAAEKAEVKASKAAQDIRQTSESCADWAGGKIAEGLGTMQENAKVASEKTKDKAGDIAMKAKDTMHGAASEAAEHTSHEATQAKEAVKNKAGEAKDNIADMAGDQATAAYDAKRAYEGAKQKVAESYATAKDTMAREKYETAKERASQVSGEVGAKMREMAREL